MADEGSLRAERERGAQARQITEHPLWDEAWTQYEAGLLRSWRASPVRDAEGREALWTAMKIAETVRKSIESIVTTGRMAEQQLEALQHVRTR